MVFLEGAKEGVSGKMIRKKVWSGGACVGVCGKRCRY